jgi:hypothetical protein
MTTGSGIFYDGITSDRRQVTVEIAVAPHVLLDHRQAHRRAEAIARIGQPLQMKALLSPPEWDGLRSICTEG